MLVPPSCSRRAKYTPPGARKPLVVRPVQGTERVPAGRSPWELDPAVREMFEAGGPEAYDLGCDYRATGTGYDEIAYDRVGHLTVDGHARVAEVLADYLSGEALRPECFIAPLADDVTSPAGDAGE